MAMWGSPFCFVVVFSKFSVDRSQGDRPVAPTGREKPALMDETVELFGIWAAK